MSDVRLPFLAVEIGIHRPAADVFAFLKDAENTPRRIRVAGLVITRQAPSTAGKIRFFTLEDEHGNVNVTIKPDVHQRYRREAAQPILVIDGVVQSHDGVWSLLATAIRLLPHSHSESRHSHDYR